MHATAAMTYAWPRRMLRWLASAAIVWAIVYALDALPGTDRVTAGMLLLLAVLAIAARWGTAEAAIASVAGGLTFDYFFLPPPGIHLVPPQHWIALFAFLATAFVTGRYSLRLKQRALEVAERHSEMERLYSLAEVMLTSDTFGAAVTQVVRQAPDIFRATSAAFYIADSGMVVRSSPGACSGLEEGMRETALGAVQDSAEAAEGRPPLGQSDACIIPVRFGGRAIGAFALCGAQLSPSMRTYIEHTLAVGLERAHALEEVARTEAARASDELRSAVLDALAHDLKTPLTSIKAAVTSLLATAGAADRELLTIIDEETDRLNRLSTQGIEMGRVGAGRLGLAKAAGDLPDTIREVIEEMRPLLSGRRVSVQFAALPSKVEFDSRLISEVLRQLIDNARKYSPERSPIGVSCRPSTGGVVVQVADWGAGIPEQEQEMIFDKFYRGPGGAGSAGVGLGLAIAKSIVKAHGGEIWVTSRPKGATVFHFSLPCCKTAQAGTGK